MTPYSSSHRRGEVTHGEVAKQSKASASESERADPGSLLALFLDQIDEGVLFIEKSGEITEINARALELLSLKPEPLPSLYTKRIDDQLFGFSIQLALESEGSRHTSTLTLAPQEGSTKPRILKIRAISASLGLLLLVKDQTALQQIQEQTDRQRRLQELGELASSLAHEIRNPVTAIEGFSALLARDLKTNPAVSSSYSMAQAIVTACQALNHHLDQLLHYTRASLVNLKQQDLRVVIKEVVKAVQAAGWIKPNQKLSIDSSEEPVLIPCDWELIQASLTHLCRNALEAIGEKGKVHIHLGCNEKEAWIDVEDNGEGISKENMPKIFRPFFTTKAEGNGLGLCEVNKMMHAQGGKISVTSSLGQGSRFTLIFPFETFDQKANDNPKKNLLEARYEPS